MTRGALSGDSIVRTERWWPPDRGDPPSLGMAGWEIGASTCGPDTRMSSRSLHKVSTARDGSLTEDSRDGRGPPRLIVWGMSETPHTDSPDFDDMTRDIAEVPAVEVIVTVAVNLMSAPATP